MLREVVPGLSRVGVLWDGESQGSAVLCRHMQLEARAMGITLHPLDALLSSTPEQLFAAITQARPEALYVFNTGFPPFWGLHASASTHPRPGR